MSAQREELRVVFENTAPNDEEWSAHINILNKYTSPDRYLREIIQYARSGEFYPADMHVDLIRQINEQHTQRLVLEGKIELLTEQITGFEQALAKADEEIRFIFQPVVEGVRESRAGLQSQLDKLNGEK